MEKIKFNNSPDPPVMIYRRFSVNFDAELSPALLVELALPAAWLRSIPREPSIW